MFRRIVITSIVLLLAGAILNTLAAWTIVACGRTRVFDAGELGRLRAAAFAEEDRQAQGGGFAIPQPYYSGLFESFGTRVLQSKSAPSQLGWREEQAAGWPMFALKAERVHDVARTPQTRWGRRLGTMTLDFPTLPGFSATAGGPPSAPIALGTPTTTDRLLPLRPIWPGFAINSISYAAVAWLLWVLYAMSIRLQRQWRGRCGRCAYPVGTSPVCTECGSKVKPRLSPR